MKCKYGDTWLTGEPWQEGAGLVEWSAEQLVEVTGIIGADTPRVAGRGNVSDRVPVPVSRQFETAEAALAFLVALPWDLPADGELRFEEGSKVVVFPVAAFNTVRRSRRGAAVSLVFEFTVAGPPVIDPEEEE
jgi:hypothetical protein